MMHIEILCQSITSENGIQKEVKATVEAYPKGDLYIFFDMGSIRLDIEDPNNHILFYCDYTSVFNHETGETTLIKNSVIKGFVFEDKPDLDGLKEDLKEVLG